MSSSPHIPAAIVLTQPQIPELAQIGEQLERFRANATELTAQASRAVILSEETFKKGTDFLTLVKTNADEVEKLRKVIKRPIDDYAKRIQDTFLPVINELTAASNAMKARMLTYRTEEDRKARLAAEAARKVQEDAALARAAELEKQGNTVAAAAVVEMAAAPLAAPQKTEGFRGDFGGKASIRATWTADITNKREFLKAVLDGSIEFNLADISVSQLALNKLASSLKVACERGGVKVYTNATMSVRS